MFKPREAALRQSVFFGRPYRLRSWFGKGNFESLPILKHSTGAQSGLPFLKTKRTLRKRFAADIKRPFYSFAADTFRFSHLNAVYTPYGLSVYISYVLLSPLGHGLKASPRRRCIPAPWASARVKARRLKRLKKKKRTPSSRNYSQAKNSPTGFQAWSRGGCKARGVAYKKGAYGKKA
jgi:hypothetical protein